MSLGYRARSRVLPAFFLLVGASTSRADPLLGDLAATARSLAPPPAPEQLLARSREELDALAGPREPLGRWLESRVPLSPKGLPEEAPRGTGLSLEELAATGEQLRFEGLLAVLRGRRSRGLRVMFRTLRLGHHGLRLARSEAEQAACLSWIVGAYLDLGRGLLGANLPEARLVKLGRLLRAYQELLPGDEVLPALLRRGLAAFESRLEDEGASLSPQLRERARGIFREHTRALAMWGARRSPGPLDRWIAERVRGLVEAHRESLGGLREPPFQRGLGARVATLRTARELARTAWRLARVRARTGRWPSSLRGLSPPPRDWLGGGPLRLTRVEGEPVLASVGEDGRWDDFRAPEDLLLGSDRFHWRLARVQEYARSLDVRSLGRLYLAPGEEGPPEPAPLPPRPPSEGLARRACEALREGLSRGLEDLERELGVELEEDPGVWLALLAREGFYRGPTRCPGQGLLALVGGRWTCTRHPSGYDPRPTYTQQLLERVVCQRRRLREAEAVERFHREVDRDLRESRSDYQEVLLERGYLSAQRRCPASHGEWNLTRAGLVCSQHLPAVRIEPMP